MELTFQWWATYYYHLLRTWSVGRALQEDSQAKWARERGTARDSCSPRKHQQIGILGDGISPAVPRRHLGPEVADAGARREREVRLLAPR